MIIYRAFAGMEYEPDSYVKLFFKKEDAEKYLERLALELGSGKEYYTFCIREEEVFGPDFAQLLAKCKKSEEEIEDLRSREMNLDDIADYKEHEEKKILWGIRAGFEYALDQYGVFKDGEKYIGCLMTNVKDIKKEFNPKEILDYAD